MTLDAHFLKSTFDAQLALQWPCTRQQVSYVMTLTKLEYNADPNRYIQFQPLTTRRLDPNLHHVLGHSSQYFKRNRLSERRSATYGQSIRDAK